jgi:hypothetical protein
MRRRGTRTLANMLHHGGEDSGQLCLYLRGLRRNGPVRTPWCLSVPSPAIVAQRGPKSRDFLPESMETDEPNFPLVGYNPRLLQDAPQDYILGLVSEIGHPRNIFLASPRA